MGSVRRKTQASANRSGEPKERPARIRNRPDKDSWAKSQYDKNRHLVLIRDEVCAICGGVIDKRLKFPHPMSASIDHIIPISKGGHPSNIDNLQLTHLICNQVKGSRLVQEQNKNIQKETELIDNRNLPLAMNWLTYRARQGA